MKYDEILDIDQTDKEIVELLQKNPEITHTEIAEKVRKSQPAVGARIIKLKRKHLLAEMVGADFNKLNIKLARVDLSSKNVEELWNKFEHCPHVINAFKQTGVYNVTIEIVAPNVRTIDLFVDNCLRRDPLITDIKVNFIIDTLRKYVVPISFDIERYEDNGCAYECSGSLDKDKLKELLAS